MLRTAGVGRARSSYHFARNELRAGTNGDKKTVAVTMTIQTPFAVSLKDRAATAYGAVPSSARSGLVKYVEKTVSASNGQLSRKLGRGG